MVKYVLLMLLIQKLQISRLSKKYYVLLHIIPFKGSLWLPLSAKKEYIYETLNYLLIIPVLSSGTTYY